MANQNERGRYTPLGRLASGGMGTVCLARMTGSAGFSRLVAVKRLHPELASQRDCIGMLVDEARLAASLQHANIVNTLDLTVSDGGFNLVLEYIEGAALDVLTAAARKARERMPAPIAIAIVQGVLRGLDAAHDARSADGDPLGIVHRDVSPHNVLVGIDGVPRLIDFGIAKAMGRVVSTRAGEVRGKFAYMAPEQLLERPATRQADVYATGVLLWELLTGHRLFKGEDPRVVCAAVVRGNISPPSQVNRELSAELDRVVLQSTALSLSHRYLTAREFLDALAPFERASEDEIARWVRRIGADYLAKRAELIRNQPSRPSQTIDELMAELQAAPMLNAVPSDHISVVQMLTSLLPTERGSVVPPMVLTAPTGLLPPVTRPSRIGWIYGAALAFTVVAVGLVASDLGLRYQKRTTSLASQPPAAVTVSETPVQILAAPTLEPAPAPPPLTPPKKPKKSTTRTVVRGSAFDRP